LLNNPEELETEPMLNSYKQIKSIFLELPVSLKIASVLLSVNWFWHAANARQFFRLGFSHPELSIEQHRGALMLFSFAIFVLLLEILVLWGIAHKQKFSRIVVFGIFVEMAWIRMIYETHLLLDTANISFFAFAIATSLLFSKDATQWFNQNDRHPLEA
jgi:hypothetical protein